MLQILYSSGGLDLDIFSEKAQHNFIKTKGGGSTVVYKTYKKTDVFFREASLSMLLIFIIFFAPFIQVFC